MIFWLKRILILTSAALLLPAISDAQLSGSARRAAARSAERAAAKDAGTSAKGAARRSAVRASDRVIKRWDALVCIGKTRCPLDASIAQTFAGYYDEVVLGEDMTVYRAYADGRFKFGEGKAGGADGARYSYWATNKETGTQAIIDRSIPVGESGNTAGKVVAVRIPKGTKVYVGPIAGIKGPAGGGTQVVVGNVNSAWEVPVK